VLKASARVSRSHRNLIQFVLVRLVLVGELKG